LAGRVVAPPAVGCAAGVSVGATAVVFGAAVGVCVTRPLGLGASTLGVSTAAAAGAFVTGAGATLPCTPTGGAGGALASSGGATAALVFVRLCSQNTSPSASVAPKAPINARLTRRRRLMARTSVFSS
jgi:hypothetical protein